MTPADDRRFELLYLLLIHHRWRAGNRASRRWAEEVLRDRLPEAGGEWRGAVDVAWFTSELRQVKAPPGYYPAGTYERFRRDGLPLWAAWAAGLQPVAGEAELNRAIDFWPGGDADPEALIDDLIVRGQRLGAVTVLRELADLSWSEARSRVRARAEHLRSSP